MKTLPVRSLALQYYGDLEALVILVAETLSHLYFYFTISFRQQHTVGCQRTRLKNTKRGTKARPGGVNNSCVWRVSSFSFSSATLHIPWIDSLPFM